ncbi:hypothetical protein [Catellatospora paridis]|uniref:hypothetical protein n=1 Tax=Catellatospora paridis TaxID=1617086 RepID=UPI0012D3C15E|nr:hypothetical protein [Catellatospora paridis]
MNSLKGIGTSAAMAGTVVAMRHLVNVDMVVLTVTIGLVAASTATYLASWRRFRRDRRIAGD